jgi:hypothetical protein
VDPTLKLNNDAPLYPYYTSSELNPPFVPVVPPHPPSASGAGMAFSGDGSFYLVIGFAGDKRMQEKGERERERSRGSRFRGRYLNRLFLT